MRFEGTIGLVALLTVACGSRGASGENPQGDPAVTTTYGATTAVAEALPDGSLRSVLTYDEDHRTLGTLTWSAQQGGVLEMAGKTAGVRFETTPSLQGMNEQVRLLWMTGNTDSLAQECVTRRDGCISCNSATTWCDCCWFTSVPDCECISTQ